MRSKSLIVKKLDKLPRSKLLVMVFEGVELVGYHEKSDSFVIKHPNKDAYWIVSKDFIKELNDK